MKEKSISGIEELRLQKQYCSNLLDKTWDSKFDEILETVAQVCEVKTAYISLIEGNQQSLRSSFGLAQEQSQIGPAFCSQEITDDEYFEIIDIKLEPRISQDPFFVNKPHIRFYAGMSLTTSDNYTFGTLCVLDLNPRTLSVQQRKFLKTFAKHIVEFSELNSRIKSLEHVRTQYLDVQSIVQAGAWELDVLTDETQWSDQIYEIYKIPMGTPINKIDALSYYAQEDRVKLSKLLSNSMSNGEMFDDTFEFYDSQKNKKWVRSVGRPVKNAQGEVVKIIGTFQDVSSLVAKKKELETVISNISEGYFDWRIKDSYKYMSPRFWEMLGYDYREKNHHPDEWLSIVHPDDLESAKMVQETNTKSDGSKPFSLDVRCRHSSGSYVWIKYRGRAVEWDEHGRVERIVGTQQDIQQEKIIADEASRIKNVLESHAIIARTDSTGRITYVNDLFCDISKYSREELLGADHRILNSGDHPKSFFEKMWSTIKAKKSWRGEIKNKAKDGSYYWVDTTIVPLTSILGEVQGYTAFRYDITQRKIAELKLAESNEYLDLAIEGANLGIWDWYLTNNSVNYSDRWARLRGVELKDLNMDLKDWESRVHPEDLPDAYQKINDYLQGKTSFFEHIHRVKHSDGRWVYILGRGRFSQYDSSGKPLRFTGTDMDVTELISNKIKLDLFFRKAPYGIAFCDLKGKFIEINEELSRITGYTKDELNNLSYWDLSLEKYKNEDLLQLELLEKTGSYGPYRKEFKSKNGKLIPVKLNGFIVEDYDGKKGVWSIIEDITQKARLESEKNKLLEQYHEANGKLEAIFKFSPVVVYECLLNQNWTMNFISPYIEAISGYKDTDFLNDSFLPFVNIIHPNDQSLVNEKVLDAVSKNTRYSIQYRVVHKDGEIKWVWEQGAKSPVSNSLIGVIADITEKKKNEDLESLLTDVRSKFIEFSSNEEAFFKYLLGKILELTTSEYGFVGDILEDTKGKYLKTLALTDISWDESTKKLYQENAAQGLEFRNLDTLFGEVIKTGKLLITNDAPAHPKAAGIPKGHPPLNKFMGVPIVYNHKAIAMVAVANSENDYKEQDLSYLKPFFELIGEMIHSIKISTELEIQKKISLHNAKLASVGELAAGVGHEINNPLAVIMGQLELLGQFCEDNNFTHPEIERRITKSLKSVERITNIVKGLRSFARADDQEMAGLNLTVLLKDTLEMLNDLYGKESITLQVQIQDDLTVYGNRGRLQQVFVNILNNAKDAVAESEMKIISINAHKNGKTIEVKIRDTGPGIADQISDKIFDPFFTTKEVNKGTGIGLALVSSIIKDHSGTISIDKGNTSGACFVISLQAHSHSQEQSVVKAKIDARLPEKVLSKGRILVVDDEEDLREILKEFLESTGYEVYTASNGKDALGIITKRFDVLDLIISDLKMPIMNGLELAQAVRSFEKYKGAFLFITGGVNIPFEEYNKIVDGVLTKPFDKAKALETIEKFIKKNNLRSDASQFDKNQS